MWLVYLILGGFASSIIIGGLFFLYELWKDFRPPTKKGKALAEQRRQLIQEKGKDVSELFHDKDYLKTQAEEAIGRRRERKLQGQGVPCKGVVTVFESSLSGDASAMLQYAKISFEMEEYIECILTLDKIKDSRIKDIKLLQEKNRVCGMAYRKMGYNTQAIKYLQNAAELGDKEAGDQLIDCLEESDDHGMDLKILTALEKQGSAKASYHMGKLYMEGVGVTKNKMQATNLFYKVLENPDADTVTCAKANYRLWKMGEKDVHGNKINKSVFESGIRQGEKQGDKECKEICMR